MPLETQRPPPAGAGGHFQGTGRPCPAQEPPVKPESGDAHHWVRCRNRGHGATYCVAFRSGSLSSSKQLQCCRRQRGFRTFCHQFLLCDGKENSRGVR